MTEPTQNNITRQNYCFTRPPIQHDIIWAKLFLILDKSNAMCDHAKTQLEKDYSRFYISANDTKGSLYGLQSFYHLCRSNLGSLALEVKCSYH